MTAPAVDRIFPNDRLSYRYDAATQRVYSAAGAKVWIFEDEDMTRPAKLRFYPGGQMIPDGMIVIGQDTLVPEFLEVSGKSLETLWALSENATTPYRMDSRLADRVAAVEAMTGTATGAGGRNFYRHDQLVAAAQWTVNHTLVRLPTVTVIVDGSAADTDIDYPTVSQVVATFPEPTVGTLICT